MKAVHLPGYPANKWLIDLEFSPWVARVYVYRSEGRDGTAILFDSQSEAEAKIAELEAAGLQGIIDHHKPEPAPKPPRLRKAKDTPDA